ncbi:coiled-coil domain-containing protein 17 isoform X1 [Silurus asotus]|uniref:Coiled-coil domain-containing protein 17 isoform X1 n=1 Tax=Silurus asotus TaxID=30991 RepID=A0AAD5FG90_SILAS|nr:coiled-coil domain-containing protein 17 isoform X1 [Silurus asotus]
MVVVMVVVMLVLVVVLVVMVVVLVVMVVVLVVVVLVLVLVLVVVLLVMVVVLVVVADDSEHRHTEDLAEVHQGNAMLSDGHKQVDMQRREFDYKLQELAAQNGKVEELERMLFELKELRPVEQEMRAATMDIDLIKHEIEINRLQKQTMSRKQVPSLMAFPPQEEFRSSPVTKHLMIKSDGLHLRPYDPKVCRLVVGMFSRDVCLGSTSILPPVYCNPFSPSQHNQEQNAIFASKQAVPDVQPASSISLVIQVQASGGDDVYSQEVTHLAPRGWMKLCIFDHHNRLISGRWKVPVRLLPAKPSMTTAEVNAVPQVDNAELYLRIVNARDAEIQSSLPVSINNAGIYQYPPVQSPRHQLGMQEPPGAIQSPYVQSAQVHASVCSQRPVNTPL